MGNTEFDLVFIALRKILQKHSRSLNVTADTPGYYCVSIENSPKLGKSFPAAWIRIGKNYVSYHFMPIYMFPVLRDRLSAPLRARMQGKSCFNFKKIDSSLFLELGELTSKGFAISKKAGIV